MPMEIKVRINRLSVLLKAGLLNLLFISVANAVTITVNAWWCCAHTGTAKFSFVIPSYQASGVAIGNVSELTLSPNPIGQTTFDASNTQFEVRYFDGKVGAGNIYIGGGEGGAFNLSQGDDDWKVKIYGVDAELGSSTASGSFSDGMLGVSSYQTVTTDGPHSGFDCENVVDVAAEECHALQELADQTDVAGWLNNGGGWIDPFDATVCDAYGVTCLDGTVISLSLADNNLAGFIPTHLGSLTRLEIADLSSNYLMGYIPGEIGDIGALMSLQLEENDLEGEIPTALTKLTALQEISLNSNCLYTGEPTLYDFLFNLSDNDFRLQDKDCAGRTGYIWPGPEISMNFDELEKAGTQTWLPFGSEYEYDGFKLSSTRTIGYYPKGSIHYNGSASIAHNVESCGSFILTKKDGTPFSVKSVDLSLIYSGDYLRPNVSFLGQLYGGGTVSKSFEVSTFGSSTYLLGHEFRTLTKLSWSGSCGNVQIDNIFLQKQRTECPGPHCRTDAWESLIYPGEVLVFDFRLDYVSSSEHTDQFGAQVFGVDWHSGAWKITLYENSVNERPIRGEGASGAVTRAWTDMQGVIVIEHIGDIPQLISKIHLRTIVDGSLYERDIPMVGPCPGDICGNTRGWRAEIYRQQ